MAIEDFVPCRNEDVNKILKFTAEIDKMTSVLRRTMLIDKSRRENDAEHSWHIAVMAILFEKFAPTGTDISRAVKMCIVHDLVEIYAGDTFAYDINGNKSKAEREVKAADKLFGMLPEDVGKEIRLLWEEFDRMETPDAKYAACMDRIQPYLHNTLTDGHTWVEGKVSKTQVLERSGVIEETLPEVWDWVLKNVENGVKNGWIADK
ncbi:MAG: HD domain-containing protein [Treponema sp.]|nr:HD domain-containing protein [Treponema sp.]